MSEVEKMYKNAGVETNKYKICCTGCKHISKVEVINGYPSEWICDKYDEVANCDKAEPDYPPFTAEKQLEITKFLFKKSVYYDVKDDKYWFYWEECESAGYKPYDEAIAHFINRLWQDLTKEERKQIKEILE